MKALKVAKISGSTKKEGPYMLLVQARILGLNGALRKPCSSIIKIWHLQVFVTADAKALYSMDRFNTSGRKSGGDHVSVLRIDSPGGDGLFGLRQMKPVGYVGSTGNGELALHGFDVEVLNDGKLRFWMINHQPPLDEVDDNRTFAHAYRHGANSTIEVFDVIRGGEAMQHVKTIAKEAIDTPNNLAATGDGGLLVTNDHSAKGEPQSSLLMSSDGGS